MKKILLSFFTLFIVQTSFSQIDYDVMIDRLYSAADDSDGSGDEDPTWRVRLQDNAGGAVQTSNCFNTTHAYNSWWDINYVFFSATNSNASSFSSYRSTLRLWVCCFICELSRRAFFYVISLDFFSCAIPCLPMIDSSVCSSLTF